MRLVSRSTKHRPHGQSLAEFALVFPIFMLLAGAIIQGGILFWAQNTLTQVARDTGRWAATQQTPGCMVANQPAQATAVIAKAVQIGSQSSLIGFNGTSFAGATVTWQGPDGRTGLAPGDPCPPTGNTGVAFVTVTLTHNVPVFFPLLPGTLTTSTQFRMEPVSGS